jgi:hypothetical protein
MELKCGCNRKVVQSLSDRNRELKSGLKGVQGLKGLRSRVEADVKERQFRRF